jgi:predicted lipoprotein with Yx(FWY)xxD motif
MNFRGKGKFSSTLGLGLSAAALAAFAAACGGSGSSGSGSSASASSAPSSASSSAAAGSAGAPASGTAASVTTRSGALGTYLADGSGASLYMFASDTSTKSTCSGACAAQWPPLTTKDAPKAGRGATAGKLTTITRDDGTKQVAYNGHPLYYFKGDSSAGQTNGQGIDGFGAKWWVLSPAGSQITKAASSSSGGGSSDSSGSSGGYGY